MALTAEPASLLAADRHVAMVAGMDCRLDSRVSRNVAVHSAGGTDLPLLKRLTRRPGGIRWFVTLSERIRPSRHRFRSVADSNCRVGPRVAGLVAVERRKINQNQFAITKEKSARFSAGIFHLPCSTTSEMAGFNGGFDGLPVPTDGDSVASDLNGWKFRLRPSVEGEPSDEVHEKKPRQQQCDARRTHDGQLQGR